MPGAVFEEDAVGNDKVAAVQVRGQPAGNPEAEEGLDTLGQEALRQALRFGGTGAAADDAHRDTGGAAGKPLDEGGFRRDPGDHADARTGGCVLLRG